MRLRDGTADMELSGSSAQYVARARATRVGGTMRVSYNSSTPDRQSGNLGAAPSIRSTVLLIK